MSIIMQIVSRCQNEYRYSANATRVTDTAVTCTGTLTSLQRHKAWAVVFCKTSESNSGGKVNSEVFFAGGDVAMMVDVQRIDLMGRREHIRE